MCTINIQLVKEKVRKKICTKIVTSVLVSKDKNTGIHDETTSQQLLFQMNVNHNIAKEK